MATTRGTGRPARQGRRAGATTLVLATGVLVALAAGPGSGPAVAGVPLCQGQPATVVGTPAADELTGTSGDDVIVGLGGSDTVRALGGDDVVCGGERADRLAGGPGADRLYGQGDDPLPDEGPARGDTLAGGAGDDLLDGGVGGAGLADGADVATYAASAQPVTVVLPDGTATGDGSDELVGVENLVGSAFGDVVLNRTPPSDDVGTVHGRGGADRLRATGWMTGGAGADVLRLLPGAEFVDGGPGDDRISAARTTRRDYGYLYGGAGDDVLVGGPGRDYLQGGTGDDRGSGGPRPDHLDLRGGSDQARGGDGADLITLDGPRSERGDMDVSRGGRGTDTAGVWESRGGVTLDLSRDRVSGPGRDRISAVENLSGTTGSDTLIGNAGRNRLLGDFGADSLHGRGGSDSLSGGPGDDRADGGPGRDTCAAETTRSC